MTRFFIGIDLGTTQSLLSYIDKKDPEKKVVSLSVEQLLDFSSHIQKKALPSFCYIPTKNELKKDSIKLTWQKENWPLICGEFAKNRFYEAPSRVIHSAKSWLCHNLVDRKSPILPWHSEEIIGRDRFSPVEVSAFYLRLLKEFWDHFFVEEKDSSFTEQTIAITVPASFDEVASSLTMEACSLAGYPLNRVSLLEEPKACFYFWLYQNGVKDISGLHNLSEFFPHGEEKNILVCDIGGGTSDFSLFKVTNKENLSIERIAVSSHLLIGGDNIDLAIAKKWETQLGKPLPSRSWLKLVFEARRIKESILSEKTTKETVVISGEGSSLFAKTISFETSSEEVCPFILENFFPFCKKDASAHHSGTGLKEWGLPYAEDTRITHYLAEFIQGNKVDYVLCNGGTLIPPLLQERILNIISTWQDTPVKLLRNEAMEESVAHGAAISSFLKSQSLDYITGGYPRSIYLKIRDKQTDKDVFLCIVPKGYDGTKPLCVAETRLHAVINRAVSFQLYFSVSKHFAAGSIHDIPEQDLQKLAPLTATLTLKNRKNKKVSFETTSIVLVTSLSETGLLEICCKENSGQEWPLRFNLQEKLEYSSFSENKLNAVSSEHLHKIQNKISDAFEGVHAQKISGLITQLEEDLTLPRKEWDLQLLRQLASYVLSVRKNKAKTSVHEALWFNLCGYTLRPGYGNPQDTIFLKDILPVLERGPEHAKEIRVKDQWNIFLRRIAGGLSAAQQEIIFNKLYPILKSGNSSVQEIMLLGSLERLELNKKVNLGHQLVLSLCNKKYSKPLLIPMIWSLCRVMSRTPLYAGSEAIIPPSYIEPWLTQLFACSAEEQKEMVFLYSQATRVIEDRYLTVREEVRQQAKSILLKFKADSNLVEPLEKFIPLQSNISEKLFGEQMPSGIILT